MRQSKPSWFLDSCRRELSGDIGCHAIEKNALKGSEMLLHTQSMQYFCASQVVLSDVNKMVVLIYSCYTEILL